jgi:hypothetical protein
MHLASDKLICLLFKSKLFLDYANCKYSSFLFIVNHILMKYLN